MTALWIVIAVLTLVGLLFLLLPLVRGKSGAVPARGDYDLAVYEDQLKEVERDLERGLLSDEQAVAARIEIQRRMLAADAEVGAGTRPVSSAVNNALVAVLAICIPVGALGIYLLLGSPSEPDQPLAGRTISPQVQHAKGSLQDAPEMGNLVAKLAQRMKEKPDDLDGWLLLARSYMGLKRFSDAAESYQQARIAGKDRPDIVASYGEALMMAGKGEISEEARRAFQVAMGADPYEPKSRYYLSVDLAQKGNTRGALQGWVDLVHVSPGNAPWLEPVREQIARAEQELGLESGAVKPTLEAQELAKAIPQKEAPIPTASPPSAPGPSQSDVDAAAQMSNSERDAMIRSMVARLADRLKDAPDDLQGWQRLANAYRVLGETEKAKAAEARVEVLQKNAK
ncbi:MAG: c-type cytochrome biogenesis protein CcmI [Rhodospirillales bacterium]|nr:c-type cytochrome biogenesis protein CcmI [Rhodospirillales bacterium]